MNIEAPFLWDPRLGRYKTEPVIDPNSGFISRWEKDENPYALVRFDQSPDQSFKRKISFVSYSEGLLKRWQLTKKSPIQNREFSFEEDGPLSDKLYASLDIVGKFTFLQIQALYLENTLSYVEIESQPRRKNFTPPTFSEKIREVAQIFKDEGESGFSVFMMGIVKDKDENNPKLEAKAIETVDKVTDIVKAANYHPNYLLVPNTAILLRSWQILEQEVADLLTSPEIHDLGITISRGVLEKLPRNFPDLPPREQQSLTEVTLGKEIGDLLGKHRARLHLLNGSQLHLEFHDQGVSFSERKILPQIPPPQNFEIGYGESFKYKGKQFIFSSLSDERIGFDIRNYRQKGMGHQFTLPRQIEPHILELIQTEQRSGWEEAFNLLNIEYAPR